MASLENTGRHGCGCSDSSKAEENLSAAVRRLLALSDRTPEGPISITAASAFRLCICAAEGVGEGAACAFCSSRPPTICRTGAVTLRGVLGGRAKPIPLGRALAGGGGGIRKAESVAEAHVLWPTPEEMGACSTSDVMLEQDGGVSSCSKWGWLGLVSATCTWRSSTQAPAVTADNCVGAGRTEGKSSAIGGKTHWARVRPFGIGSAGVVDGAVRRRMLAMQRPANNWTIFLAERRRQAC